jgi:hypothetical protein
MVAVLDLVAAAVIFAHFIWPHRHRSLTIWSVTVGTNMAGYQPVASRSARVVGAGPPTTAFWVGTAIVGVCIAANVLLLAVSRRRVR